MFEFMCGSVPFGENAEDPMDVYLAIINEKMIFPPFVKDKEFKNLINMMLSKNPLNRIYELSHVKNNIFFKDFNWVKIFY
jgi:cGMP-dependent protein kinase